MTVVLNEHEWAENMINSCSLGKDSFETLSRVARYYLDKGYSKKDVRKKIELFAIQCNAGFELSKKFDSFDQALNKAMKYEAVNISSIDITDKEMAKINALNGKQIRRFAFTLLCLAKYWNAINPNANNWVINKDNEIMQMANLNTSIKRQSMMYKALRDVGMIQFSKKVDNTNVQVCFIEDGNIVMLVTDFRNLGYQYLKYCGEPYFECQNCGITTKVNSPNKGRKQKYCKDCATKIKNEQDANRAAKL